MWWGTSHGRNLRNRGHKPLPSLQCGGGVVGGEGWVVVGRGATEGMATALGFLGLFPALSQGTLP